MKKRIFLILFLAMLATVAFAADKNVAVLPMDGNWQADGDLSWQAMAISIQGIANRDAANIYLLYPETHEHPNSKAVLKYYQKRHGVKTMNYADATDLVKNYHEYLQGYVVWDRDVMRSLMVAFTVAGLKDALIVSEKEVALAQELGLKKIADFRGQFTGQTDAEIFQWAIDEYWADCSRDYLVYLGEWCKLGGKPAMTPAIADFAIRHKAFCTDLSTSPADPDEFVLAEKLHMEMNDYSYMFGWHSYCKDQEGEHLTLLSRAAMAVGEGVATLPNMSFHANIPVSKGFKFKQKAQPDLKRVPADKVYIALIQTDGLGLGAWLKPGRGSLPYGWEANMEWMDLAPAMMQYYYETATPNDHFIASLSGPGYLYPKSYPKDKLAGMMQITNGLMDRMDLKVLGIMDYTEGNRYVGNIDLPEYIVDAYFKNIPVAKGFFNGYGPANTYDEQNNVPFISYQYYADDNVTVDDMVHDFRELAVLNPKRPYFLPVHVREYNDVERMKQVMDQLGKEFEVVNPTELVSMASRKNTMTQRLLDYKPDFSGHWKLDRKASKHVFSNSFTLEIQQQRDLLTISSLAFYSRFIHHREWKNEKTMTIGGEPVITQDNRTRRMKHLAAWTNEISTRAEWAADSKTLLLITEYDVETYQGTAHIVSTAKCRLSADNMTLTIEEFRSTRDSDEPVTTFVYQRQL